MGEQPAHVLFDYKAADGTPGHLTLTRGDMLLVNPHTQQYQDWWTGTLTSSGAVGMFPSSYVELIESSATFPARCLYDFAGEHDGTLKFATGDILTVVKEADGWWEGFLGAHYGMFPANYVEKQAVDASPSSPALPPPDAVPASMASPRRSLTGSSKREDRKSKSDESSSAAHDNVSPRGSPASPVSSRREKKEKKRTHRKITQDMILRDGDSSGASTPSRGSLTPATSATAAELLQLNERQNELEKREAELAVGEAALKRAQVKLKKKESELAEREDAVRSREKAVERSETHAADRKSKLKEQEEELDRRESKLKKKEDKRKEAEKELAKSKAAVDKKERDLRRREKELAQEADELERRGAEMAAASGSADAAREKALRRREKRCEERLAEAESQQAALSEREYALATRQAELAAANAELTEQRAALAARALTSKASSASPSRSRRNTGSGPAAPLAAVKIDPSLNPEQRKLVLRQTVIDEIVTTEADYVADLETLVTQCLRPARDQHLLPADDVRQLFANVEELWQANSRVLQLLVERNDPTNAKVGLLGDVFVEMASTLRSYAGYVANQDTSVAAYLRLKEDAVTDQVLTNLEDGLRGLDLCGFLIKPVQRLCKYPLLIRELSKYTDESHRDHGPLQTAAAAVANAVQYVNDHQKLLEADARLLELEKVFVGLPKSLENITTGTDASGARRKFLLEASVTELVDAGSGKAEPRALFVFSDTLLLAKPQTRSKLLAYKQHIALPQVTIKELPPNPQLAHGVLLRDAGNASVVFMLNFASPAERAKAVETLAAAALVAPAARSAAPQLPPMAAGPPKPVPKQNPTPQEYKEYMRALYEYEEWQNAQLRKTTAPPTTAAPVPPAQPAAPPGRPAGPPVVGTSGDSRSPRARATQPAAPPGVPPAARRPGPAGFPVPPLGGGERAGTLKRMCKKCGQRKAVAKVVLDDGASIKVCEVCVGEYTSPPTAPAEPRETNGPPPRKRDSGSLSTSSNVRLNRSRSARDDTRSPLAASTSALHNSQQQPQRQPQPQEPLPTALPAPLSTAVTPPTLTPPPAAAAAAPLKPGWHAVTADDGRVYYYHETTNETTWDRPVAPTLPAPVALPPPLVGGAGSFSAATDALVDQRNAPNREERAARFRARPLSTGYIRSPMATPDGAAPSRQQQQPGGYRSMNVLGMQRRRPPPVGARPSE